MRLQRTYPTPILGISTLAPRNRREGQMGSQINFRSDPVNKLVRRPPLTWDALLATAGNDPSVIRTHTYRRDGDKYQLILNTVDGHIRLYKNDVILAVENIADTSYLGPNMVAQTIEHDTYWVNTDKVVTMTDTTDEDTIVKASHVNITSALNYGEAVRLTIRNSVGTVSEITYTVPALGSDNANVDAADVARTTTAVAIGLHNAILEVVSPPAEARDKWVTLPPDDPDAPTTGRVHPHLNSHIKGSSIGIVDLLSGEWLSVEVQAGQGTRSVAVFNEDTQSIDGLPLYALEGTRIKVKPNATSERGVYYLEAERANETSTVGDSIAGGLMVEVIWSETRNPTEPYEIDDNTTPFVVKVDGSSMTVSSVGLKDRRVGDNNSAKLPKFIDNKITSIGYFQQRLVFITNNDVVMSETDDLPNFWRQTAVRLLVSDTVSIASDAAGIDKLAHITSHGGDLLITSSNGQFKISGKVAVTPQTVSMPLTARYECQIDAAPVTLGSSVFLPIDYGESTGITEYTSKEETTYDVAEPITPHVVGLLKGRVKLMAANSNLQMLVVTTTGSNSLYVYEQHISSGKKVQQAWTEWTFPSIQEEIFELEFNGDTLILTVWEDGHLVVKSIRMYEESVQTAHEVFVDNSRTLDVAIDGTNKIITLPTGYNMSDLIVVGGENSNVEFGRLPHTIDGQVITIKHNVPVGAKIVVGKEFRSSFVPTRPYIYDEHGVPETIDRLRVGQFTVDMIETNELKMGIRSEFGDFEDQVFTERRVGTYVLGQIGFFSGRHSFSFRQRADVATVEFYCDNHLACSIVGIEWDAQIYRRGGR